MYIVVYTTFSKKINSTKQPDQGGYTVDVKLKLPTSMRTPAFIISRVPGVSAPSMASAKYVKWDSRYYFVTDVEYTTNDIVTIYCQLDSLATYKDWIVQSTQYITRSSQMFNHHITDPMISPTLDTVHTTVKYTIPQLTYTTGGCYILLVAGKPSSGSGTSAIGTSNAYALTQSQMNALADELYSSNILTQIRNAFTNPMDSIVSCVWLPITISTFPNTPTNIHVGDIQLSSYGIEIDRRYITGERQLLQSDMFSNQINTLGNDFAQATYLWCEPFTEIEMCLPYVGSLKLPSDIFYHHQPYIYATLDVITGDIVYALCDSTSIAGRQNVIATYSGNCASQCPVSAKTTDIKGALLAGLQFIGMASGNYMMYGGAAAIAATGNDTTLLNASIDANLAGQTIARAGTGVVGAMEISTQINGAISSAGTTEIYREITVTSITRIPTENIDGLNALVGRPLNEYLSLSTFSGYVQCVSASIDLSSDYQTRLEVENYMNTGFYIE